VEDAGHLGTELTRAHVITALDRFAAGSGTGAPAGS
jgi:hypothetical protein